MFCWPLLWLQYGAAAISAMLNGTNVSVAASIEMAAAPLPTDLEGYVTFASQHSRSESWFYTAQPQ